MKKYKLFSALSIIGAGLALASCGNTNTSGTSNVSPNPETPTVIPTPSVEVPTTSKPAPSTSTGQAITDKSFVVNVKYPDGSAVTGVKVQWCSVANGTCYTMIDVDANGQAFTNEFDNPEGDYSVHLGGDLPAGYTYNPFALIQNAENRVGTITLIPLKSTTRLEKNTTPVKLEEGYYTAKLGTAKDDTLFIYFDATQAGTYEIESYAVSPSDLLIADFGNDIEKPTYQKKNSDDDGNEKNFKYSFTVSDEDVNANKHYVFRITQKDSTSTFTFSILKK